MRSDQELSYLQLALYSHLLLFFVCHCFRFVRAKGRAGSNVCPFPQYFLLDVLPALLSPLGGFQYRAESFF
jgi:hypothetical protein